MTAPQRMSDILFHRDMVGPSFANLMATMVGLLLVIKLFLEMALPPLVPTLESLLIDHGRFGFLVALAILLFAAFYWGAGLLMAIPAFLGSSRWKIQPTKSLDVPALLRAVPLILLNSCVSVLVTPALLYATLPESSFDLRAAPSTATLVWHVAVWFAAEETLFYHAHRFMHVNKRMYAAVHKLHHTWTAPISLVAIYCHPLEHVACNILPLLAGPMLCGSHAGAIVVYVALGLLHTLAVHSGYWFCDDNGMHDEHHAKFNVNYGVLGVLDAWYGTYRLPTGAAGQGFPAKVEGKEG